jgi:hypothetical protein
VSSFSRLGTLLAGAALLACTIFSRDPWRRWALLQPNNFPDLATLERTRLAFGRHYEQIAQSLEWKFTREEPRPASSYRGLGHCVTLAGCRRCI